MAAILSRGRWLNARHHTPQGQLVAKTGTPQPKNVAENTHVAWRCPMETYSVQYFEKRSTHFTHFTLVPNKQLTVTQAMRLYSLLLKYWTKKRTWDIWYINRTVLQCYASHGNFTYHTLTTWFLYKTHIPPVHSPMDSMGLLPDM